MTKSSRTTRGSNGSTSPVSAAELLDHLHPLVHAQLVLRQFEAERGLPRGEFGPADEAEARDRVGKAINMSGRNRQRYLRVLQTPCEIQNAVRDGEVPLVVGEKVAGLRKNSLDEIAMRIRNGEPAKLVVAEFLAAKPSRQRSGLTIDRFLRNVTQAQAALDASLDRATRRKLGRVLPRLQEAGLFVSRLIAAAQR